MLAKRFGLLWACFIAPIALVAQRPSVVELVPTEAWQLSNSENLDVEAVGAWGGQPEIEKEYGVQSIEHQTYFLKDQSGVRGENASMAKSKRADVILEPASDPSAAYGLLTFYQTKDMVPAAGMRFVLESPGQNLMVRGHTFIRVIVSSPSAENVSSTELLELLKSLGANRPPAPDLVYLRGILPRAGLVPGSDKYFLGPRAVQQILPGFPASLIGFSQGAEAQLGMYSEGKQSVTILLITYPTPQIARIRFGSLQEQLGIGQERGVSTVYGKQTGSYVVLGLNSDPPQFAEKFVNEFTSSEQVTENVPRPGSEHVVGDMMRLVVANLIFSFILAGLACGGGILFFLIMIAARKWFPQTIFGQPDEATIIRLRLS